MKKAIYSFLFLLLFFSACTKKQDHAALCLEGMIKWGGHPAADGTGWYFETAGGSDDSPLSYVLKDLPSAYQVEGLAVSTCIIETNEKVPCLCSKYYYKIERIQRR